MVDIVYLGLLTNILGYFDRVESMGALKELTANGVLNFTPLATIVMWVLVFRETVHPDQWMGRGGIFNGVFLYPYFDAKDRAF
jgi:drug/metabolite transporter (DMT)-like permease